MIAAVILIAMAYAIGSLSSAIIVCKFLKLPDPRTEGSMNPGTTNVLRIGGKTPALITLAGDMIKGFLPVFIGHMLGISGFFLGLIALAAFVGHLFPVFFKFQGGKGVATFLGGLLALAPFAGVVTIVAWILVAAISRYSSLASLASAVAAPVLVLFFANTGYFFPVLIIGAMVVWRHIENIQRLRAGTEGKINF